MDREVLMDATAIDSRPITLTRQRKVALHLECIVQHRLRGTLYPERCSFYWGGIRREMEQTAPVRRASAD